ncbi:NUDIX hydrolase [Anaerosporobacter faecicola]|uniref:NUDIX hydrolase n=1 Tax=Anaerosporobacter faecicola TaxID=2718714 RepID=UPI00143C13C4|nr:NUDIX domain-containing protein [Anaerosporobacter faecicola]
MAELCDVYDINRQKTGRLKERGTLSPDEYFLGVEICIFNHQEEMLIQQRQPWKEPWAGLWDLSVGGCAMSGETSQQAATRELQEEIGVRYDFSIGNACPFFSLTSENGFYDFYILQKEIAFEQLTVSYEEVQAVKWAKKEEILSLIDQGLFLPYSKGMIELCFDQMNK